MADPILKVDRAYVEAKLKQLREMLEKQKPHEETQHLRGQIAAWAEIERGPAPKPVKKDDKPPIAIYG